MCFRYSSHLSCVFCTLPLMFLALLLLLLVWVVAIFLSSLLLVLVFLLFALYSSYYCRCRCQSKIFRGVCLEFMKNFFNGIFTFPCAFSTLCADSQKQLFEICKKGSPAIRATCTWKHVFKSFSATYVYILKSFLLICSDSSVFAIVHALSTVVYLFFWFFSLEDRVFGIILIFFSFIFVWICLNAINRLMS